MSHPEESSRQAGRATANNQGVTFPKSWAMWAFLAVIVLAIILTLIVYFYIEASPTR